MLWIHVAAGIAALMAGFIALYARKGGGTHVGSGRVFAFAMAVLAGSAVLIAAFANPNPGNIQISFMTLYLIATGWLSVRPDPGRGVHVALAALGLGAGAYGMFISVVGFGLPGRVIAGIPAAMTLIFAIVTLLALAGDLRMLRRGRAAGPARILRHLWRMGFALWIATLSFFLGQADEVPAAVRESGAMLLPVLAVTGTLLFHGLRQAWRSMALRPDAGRGASVPRQ